MRKRLATIHELEAAKRSLLEANASKDRFSSILAHDLRNPLSGLQTVSELLASRYDELPEADRRRFAGLLRDMTNQSLTLMNSLLMWVRAQTGRLPWEPANIDLSQASEETIAQLVAVAERKQARLECAVPRDTEALRRRENGHLVTSVTDTGIGIDPEDLDKLFRIDTQLSRRGTRPPERASGSRSRPAGDP